MYTLRSYQQEAVDLAIKWMRTNSEPALISISTGGGKSLICAEIARIMLELSKKKILCLCPTAELVEQNFEKYLLTGNEASIYSASISKSLRHDVVFGTEGSFKKVAKDVGSQYSTVILDEAHRITPTIKKIISDMREGNPYLRVIGMSASPYRMLDGYIFETDVNGRIVDEAVKPYFKKLLYEVGGEYLVSQGYLTRPVIGEIHAERYDTSKLELSKTGVFTQQSIDEAFVGKGTATTSIVMDVVNQANARNAESVMFFASCIDHAKEIMECLPAYNSALVTGETPKAERRNIIKDFKSKKIRFLVNISVLTTGFDCSSVSIIAILRGTESASLLTQINGRSLRLDECKTEALILDYAGNIERFFHDGNIFNPQIQAYGNKPTTKMDFICPKCSSVNSFSLRPNPNNMTFNAEGYFLTLDGYEFRDENNNRVPAHYGRRCQHVHELGKNQFERCDNFWECKFCEKCGSDNDIAARKCRDCKALLIDYNDKLIGKAIDKNDLTQIQTDRIEYFSKKKMTSKANNDMIRVTFATEYRKFVAFFSNRVNKRFYEMMTDSSFKPQTVSYKKSDKSDFFTVVDFNREADSV